MKSDLVDLEMQIHHETDGAVLASDDGIRDNAVWLPKSAIEMGPGVDRFVTITMHEQFAIDKGLL